MYVACFKIAITLDDDALFNMELWPRDKEELKP